MAKLRLTRMKVEELGIGNLLKLDNAFVAVTSINGNRRQNSTFDNFVTVNNNGWDCFMNIDKFEQIPITEECLVRCGYVKEAYEFDNEMIDTVTFKDFVIRYNHKEQVLELESDRDSSYFNHIKSLHQLQNFYTALGEELEIKIN